MERSIIKFEWAQRAQPIGEFCLHLSYLSVLYLDAIAYWSAQSENHVWLMFDFAEYLSEL